MPQWLNTILLAVALLVLVAFLTQPVLVGRQRHRAAAEALRPGKAGSGQRSGSRRLGTEDGEKARILVADHDRLVVTYSKRDNTVYVLRPLGVDPKAILRVARLVLAEEPYQELAAQLGMHASWPME